MLLPAAGGPVTTIAEPVSVCNTLAYVDERFDPDLLDDEYPFEIDAQAAHLFKHPNRGVDDIDDVWASDPLFYRPSLPRTG